MNAKIAKDYLKNFHIWRDYDLLTCILAIVSLALAIVDFEYCSIKAISLNFENKDAATEAQTRLELSQSSFSRVVVALISFISVVTIY